jgi:hypothetical protein
MKRVLVLTMAVALVNASTAFAGDGLLQSVNRIAKETARTLSAAPAGAKAAVPTARPELASSPLGGQAAPVLAQQEPSLESSGMGTGMKILIAVAAGVGFAATAYTIDHHVEDNTLSSHGLRQDY